MTPHTTRDLLGLARLALDLDRPDLAACLIADAQDTLAVQA